MPVHPARDRAVVQTSCSIALKCSRASLRGRTNSGIARAANDGKIIVAASIAPIASLGTL
jgi:hypothetical protein